MTRPFTKAQLLEELTALAGGDSFWTAMPPDVFVRNEGGLWSAADTVRHLEKSTKPVATALRMPRPVLRVMFGGPADASMQFDDLATKYEGVLAAGGKAGKFAPAPLDAGVDAAAVQQDAVAGLASSVASLARALEDWRDEDLERYRLPHPLLGKLTVREMVMFTLYHHEHHLDVIARRLGLSESVGD